MDSKWRCHFSPSLCTFISKMMSSTTEALSCLSLVLLLSIRGHDITAWQWQNLLIASVTLNVNSMPVQLLINDTLMFLFQNHQSVATPRLGSILAVHLSVHAIGVHVSVLHTGNQNALHRPGKWNHFTVHPVRRLQPTNADSGVFGTPGSYHQCHLCQTHRLDSVGWAGQVFRLPQHRNRGTSRLLHVRGHMYSHAVSFSMYF